MKKKNHFLVLIVFFLLVLPGCWDYSEYENMVQVITMGVDFNRESNETTVTIQYIPTTKQSAENSKGSSEKDGVVYSATDKTLFGAISKLREVTYKEIFLGYLKIIVVGEEAAKYKTMDLMELFNRTPSIRDNAYLVISSGKAEDTISTFDAAHQAPSGEQIYNLINLSKFTGTAFSISIHEFTQMMAVPGIEAAAPRVITVFKKPQSEAEGGTQGKIRFVEKREGAQRVSGIAVFKKDRLVGWLDEKESFGFSWITGKNPHAYKESEISDGTDTEDIFYYRVKSSKSKIKAQMDNGEPVINVNVTVTAELRKYYSNKGSEIITSEEVSVMEKKLSDSVRSDIEAALEKGQTELESDIFGFGFAFYRKHTKLWQTEYERKWEDIFPNIVVNVNVDAIVKNTSAITRGLIIK